MNFLGHLTLSGNDSLLMLGNFMGDFVKGKKYELYEGKIRTGILLHREIDTFTDSHPIVAKSKSLLRDPFGLYAGVIVDVFYDHILAKHFQQFNDKPLEVFSQSFYRLIRKHQAVMPERILRFFPYMETQNWLVGYRETKGIERTLNGLEQRTSSKVPLPSAMPILEKYFHQFEADFLAFFPLALKHVEEHLAKH